MMIREKPRRVAIFRSLQLGDLLCAVPAWRAIRGAWPDAEIVLIGLPWAGQLVERFGAYLDRFLEFPGHPSLPEREPDLARWPGFLKSVRGERFDLAIQLHGSGVISNGLVERFGARATAGYFDPNRNGPRPRHGRPYPETGSEVRRLLDLVTALGIASRGEHLEFPILAGDRRERDAIAEVRNLAPGSYACVHPGASVPERRWSPEAFAAVADRLARRGLRIVLTGTAGESPLTRAVQRATRSPAIDLAGRTSLGGLAALLEGARLLVCNDTGVSHVAAALRLPSVVLAPAANIARWAPADRERHRCLTQEANPREAIKAAEDLLRDRSARAG